MSNKSKPNGIASPTSWRAAWQKARETSAEPLRLPSGATILAARPEPLEWIISGRIPQRLLGAALDADASTGADQDREITRQEIVELAEFATRLVKASVVRPPIGEGPGEISLDDIPVADRAFIFEWACRALGENVGAPGARPTQEELSSASLERFRAK